MVIISRMLCGIPVVYLVPQVSLIIHMPSHQRKKETTVFTEILDYQNQLFCSMVRIESITKQIVSYLKQLARQNAAFIADLHKRCDHFK